MNGMAVLAGFELMSERLAVALDSGDQEDEHSCFSDTTHQDFVYDLKGIENVWNGTYPGGSRARHRGAGRQGRPGARRRGDGAPRRRDGEGRRPRRSVGQGARRPDGQPRARGRRGGGRRRSQKLGDGLKRAGNKLGVLVQIPAG